MRNLIRALVLLPALALNACGGGGDSHEQPAAVELGEEFLLGIGETIDVDSLSITFNAVTEDSRCPRNANCIALWEGNARVQLAVTNGRIAQIVELNTNSQMAHFVIFEGHFIELRGLDPLPWSPPRSPENYVATLFVDGQVVPAH